MNGRCVSRREFLEAVGAVGLVAACAPQAASVPAPQPSSPAGTSGAPAAWQNTWEGWVAGAKQEGQLNVAINMGAGFDQALGVFQRAYPGIDVQNQVFQSASLLIPRIVQERDAGVYTWDLAIFTFQSMLANLKPTGAVDPVRPVIVRPDVTENSVWIDGFEDGFRDNDKQWVYVFNEYSTSGFAANTDLVKEGEIKSVQDLLDPKWKGKMLLLDVRGGSFPWFLAIRQTLGDAVLKRLLVDQQPTWSRDNRQITEALLRGSYPIALLASKSYLKEFADQGLGKNVKFLNLPESRATIAGAGALWLMNKAPHPNAARGFINWLLTKEGQEAWNATNIGNSRRKDVSVADQDYVKVPGGSYTNMIREDTIQAQQDVQKFVEDLIR